MLRQRFEMCKQQIVLIIGRPLRCIGPRYLTIANSNALNSVRHLVYNPVTILLCSFPRLQCLPDTRQDVSSVVDGIVEVVIPSD